LNATNLLLDQRTLRRIALTTRLLSAAALLASATVLPAQVVKAPRYTGGVETPTQQLSLPPVPKAIISNGTVVEDIVVRVNDQIITRSDVERQLDQLNQAVAQGGIPKEEVVSEQKNMLRDMIDQQLLLSRAKEMGLNADADVIRQLDQIRMQNHLNSMDELKAAAAKEGVNFEDFQAQIRNKLLTQKVVQEEVGRKLQVTQAEEKRYYDAHIQEFQQPEQIRLSEILIPTPADATAEQIRQAETKANEVRGMIAKGGDFSDLAKKYSGGPSAAQGGDLGLFKPGSNAKVIEDQTFALKVGDSTQPIRTRQGFVVLKVTQHDKAGPAPMKSVEPQIEEGLYMEQMQPAMRAYLSKLRDNAYVDIQPGFVDSGATPNESKPLFTAYAPPAPKKKPEEQHPVTRFDRNGAYATPKAVVASPDTTGTRTITGPDAKPAVDPVTGLASMKAPVAPKGTNGKKTRREKIRFGQAPRNAIPAGTDQNEGDLPAASAPSEMSVPAGTVASANVAPGAVMASNGIAPVAPESVNLQDNPLTPRAPEQKKTRYASKEKEVKAAKAEQALIPTAKEKEKVLAKPVATPADEKASAQVQAAPLGLAGDTTKKPAKPKKVKGQPKQRLEDKPTDKKATTAPAPDPTVNPNLAPTSVPPAATPPPATPPQG